MHAPFNFFLPLTGCTESAQTVHLQANVQEARKRVVSCWGGWLQSPPHFLLWDGMPARVCAQFPLAEPHLNWCHVSAWHTGACMENKPGYRVDVLGTWRVEMLSKCHENGSHILLSPSVVLS